MSEIVSNDLNIETVLLRDGIFASVTVGSSMRPLFKTHRDMVVLKRVSGMLNKYDVVLYRVNDKYILHRIIGIDRDRGVYIIRGDNTYSKEYVKFDKILASLISFSRAGKHHSVTDLTYRIYSVVWNILYPLRYVARRPYSLLSRAYRKIFKKRSEES